ncbi:MAG: hypothetical protein ABIE46_01340 [Patescibacteria group bacterium]
MLKISIFSALFIFLLSSVHISFADETTQSALIEFLFQEKVLTEKDASIRKAMFEIEALLEAKNVPYKKIKLEPKRIQIVVGADDFCFYWGWAKTPKKNSVFFLKINGSPVSCLRGQDEKDWKEYESFLKMSEEEKEVFLRTYFEKYARIKIPYPVSKPCPWRIPENR